MSARVGLDGGAAHAAEDACSVVTTANPYGGGRQAQPRGGVGLSDPKPAAAQLAGHVAFWNGVRVVPVDDAQA